MMTRVAQDEMTAQDVAVLEEASLQHRFGLVLPPVKSIKAVRIFRVNGTPGGQQDLQALNAFADQYKYDGFHVPFGALYWQTRRGQLIGDALNLADEQARVSKQPSPRGEITKAARHEVNEIVFANGGIHETFRRVLVGSVGCLFAERWFSKQPAARGQEGPSNPLFNAMHAAPESVGPSRRYLPLCTLENEGLVTLFVLRLTDM